MLFRVTVEPGVTPGEPVRASAGGVEILVRVPKDAVHGQTFLFSVEADDLERAKQIIDFKDKPIIEGAILEAVNGSQSASSENHQHQDPKSSRLKKDNNVSDDDNLSFYASITKYISDHPDVFFSDVIHAFLLGALFGTAIMFGFVLGILYGTEPLEVTTSSDGRTITTMMTPTETLFSNEEHQMD